MQYPRLAVRISVLSLVVTAGAAWMTHNNGEIARAADRGWLGPASMRLNEKPIGGKRLEFLLEYQNSGRQPALSVVLLSWIARFDRPREMNKDRAIEDVKQCLRSNPDDFQVIFPGKGNLEPYRPGIDLLRIAIDEHSPIYIDGCFAYRTIRETHRTAFCFKYDPEYPRYDADGKLMLDLCDFGHYAD
jgi:hypothetical protein